MADEPPITQKHLDDALDKAFSDHEKREVVIAAKALETHLAGEHHLFITAMISKELRRNELWERAKGTWLSWGVITVTMFVAMVIWEYAKRTILGNGK